MEYGFVSGNNVDDIKNQVGMIFQAGVRVGRIYDDLDDLLGVLSDGDVVMAEALLKFGDNRCDAIKAVRQIRNKGATTRALQDSFSFSEAAEFMADLEASR